MADGIGLDEIIERLDPALTGGAYPRRIQNGSSPISNIIPNNKDHPQGWSLLFESKDQFGYK